MKNRFNSYDIICMVTELQRLIGMRVNQVYDIDNKTYVIRLQRSEEKVVLLMESGSRFHTTQFDWPKNVAPSGFTMKLRKHLKNKRLEKLCQLGVDRIVDLQFGSGEAAYHVIIELYDRGNIILTDYELTILNILRPHIDLDKIRFAVKEKYPVDRVKCSYDVPNEEALREIFENAKPGDTLKKILNPKLEFGSAVIDHALLTNGLSGNMKISKDSNKGFDVQQDMEKLMTALKQAEELFENVKDQDIKGFIIQKKEEWPDSEGSNYLLTNLEFHPMLFAQFKTHPHTVHETFDRAVDEFFSALEGQKIDLKTLQIEREAMKKLANVRKDHEKRVNALQNVQIVDKRAAEMISRNDRLVENARLAIQTALANQMSWDDIKYMVKSAQDNKDPVALAIKQLKLNTNHITMLLKDPYHDLGSGEENSEDRLDPMLVDIDLSLTAFANARRYYDQRRNAAKKQQKTLESAGKALKSAERKTKQTLKEVNTISNISKARKTYWFEKFFWFISSDNYLVIAGRDQQQNEMLVKRYMRAGDIYVHAEVTGASSVVIKNPHNVPVPPKTLSEAGQAAVAYSVAWEAKVLTRAWWVYAHQVSKSAPTGEYLSTGSFMIRGRKNYLLPEHLQFGFSFMFRLEDGCIERHRDERKAAVFENTLSDVSSLQDQELVDIVISDDDDDDEPSEKESSNGSSNRAMDTITEERSLNTVLGDNTTIADSFETEFHDTSKTKSTEELKNDDINEQNKEGDEIVESNESEDEDKKVLIEVETEEKTQGIHKQEKDGEIDETQVENPVEMEEEELKKDERTDKDDSDSDSDSEGVLHTHIKIDHETGQVFTKTRTMSEKSDKTEEENLMSFPALPKNRSKKPSKKENAKENSKQEKTKDGPKRGQKGKLKKMKEKYKNQDEEDRARIMELLKPAKADKESKKAEKAAKNKAKVNKSGPRSKIPQPVPVILEQESGEEDVEPEPETEQAVPDEHADTLAQLTGAPHDDDELLFAVPVVAPYSALFHYKFKVKLMPGTSKRGKAAKTAVQVFLRDKACSAREKDLLKAVKEENIARNFPGKVKLSAPQLHKHKK